MICKYCGHKNRDEAKFCTKCGKTLEPVAKSNDVENSEEKITCQNCGATVSANMKFCNKCGQPISAAKLSVPPKPVQAKQEEIKDPHDTYHVQNDVYNYSNTPVPPQNNSKKKIIIGVIIGVGALVLAGIIVGAIFLFTNLGSGSNQSTSSFDTSKASSSTSSKASSYSSSSSSSSSKSSSSSSSSSSSKSSSSKSTSSNSSSKSSSSKSNSSSSSSQSNNNSVTVVTPQYCSEGYPPYVVSSNSLPVFTGMKASSTLQEDGWDYNIRNLMNYDKATAWVEGASGSGIGQYVELTSSGKQNVSGICIINGYTRTKETFYNNNRVKEMTIYLSDGSNFKTTLKDSMDMQMIEFNRRIETTYIKLEINTVYRGELYDDTCLTFVGPY